MGHLKLFRPERAGKVLRDRKGPSGLERSRLCVSVGWRPNMGDLVLVRQHQRPAPEPSWTGQGLQEEQRSTLHCAWQQRRRVFMAVRGGPEQL